MCVAIGYVFSFFFLLKAQNLSRLVVLINFGHVVVLLEIEGNCEKVGVGREKIACLIFCGENFFLRRRYTENRLGCLTSSLQYVWKDERQVVY